MSDFDEQDDDIKLDEEEEFESEEATDTLPDLPPPSDERVTEICSLLIANGYLHKQDVRDLLYDDRLRERVEARLDSVGLKLARNSYSEYWGVALNAQTSVDDRLEWSNNFGLERGAMALLLVLWCKLILPKRLAQEERQPEDGSVAALFPEVEKMPNPRLSVSRDQIIAEFGDMLGGVSLTSRYIAQLARARLIKAHGGVIEEGPLLPLVIDETHLADELRREVLLSLLKRERRTVPDEEVQPSPADTPSNPDEDDDV